MHHPFDCGCKHRTPHDVWGGQYHHLGSCCQASYLPRRFPTREETIAELEEYLRQLQAEAKGIEERIAELGETS